MSTLLPTPPTTGIDQYLQSRTWCRLLSNAITLTQDALTRYGATEYQWVIFTEYHHAITRIADMAHVIADDFKQSHGALPRDEYFALARRNLWTTCGEIAAWHPESERLLLGYLGEALTYLAFLRDEKDCINQRGK